MASSAGNTRTRRGFIQALGALSALSALPASTSMGASPAALRKLGLPEATVRGIESGNAMGLVPRLRS